MTKHKHDWLVLLNNLDESVRVEYCSDRDCGQQRRVPLTEEECKAIRLEAFGYEDRPVKEVNEDE